MVIDSSIPLTASLDENKQLESRELLQIVHS